MNLDEAKRHRTKRTLTKCFGKLHHVSRYLIKAEETIELVKNFSQATQTVFENINALRKGVEETQKIISQEITRIENEMEEPSAEPPAEKGAYLNNLATPFQRHLQIPVANLPKKQYPRNRPYKVPERLEFHPTKKQQKPRTQKKLGIIPI